MSFPCYCASTECRVYGCRIARSHMEAWRQRHNPGAAGYGYTPEPKPQGCICPPTSEQTCQSPMCPRKAVR